MTPSEREALDALVKYAEVGEDWANLINQESVEAYIAKWGPVCDSLGLGAYISEYDIAAALESHCRRLALEEAREVQGDTKPVCPFCKVVMTPVNYVGFYEGFAYWSCECDEFEGVEKTKGADCGF